MTEVLGCPGLTLLADWLKEADKDAIQAVGRDILGCTDRLHAAGLCHRDVHERNVVLDDLRPLLIDFELAIEVPPDQACYDLLGPASGTPLPGIHREINLVDDVWWDSPTPHVRCLCSDFGPS